MAAKCKQPTITSDTAQRIEKRAHELWQRPGKRVRMHMALTQATREILGCTPRRAIAGEGSLNYFRSIGHFKWSGF